MNIQVISLLLLFGLAVGLAVLCGRYLSWLFRGKKSLLDFLAPLDRLLFRLGGIDPTAPMTWRQYAVALLTINGAWFVYARLSWLHDDALRIRIVGGGQRVGF